MDAPRRLRAEEPLPIAILSFDRPSYLQQLLESLAIQVSERDPIFLFQDGAENAYSGERRGNPDDIEACVEVFRRVIPWGTTLRSTQNIGIAENHERAEQHVFRTLRAKAGLFLEDDLVLGPSYLTVTRRLLDLAARDRRISYVSAYGNFWASLAEQTARQSELMHMHENWGAAITRDAWLEERPFREAYLALVRGTDYSQRNNAAIRRFYRDRGWNVEITSQDAARWVASVELGKVRLTSFSCHARYIGRRGMHFTEAHYDACSFGDAQMFDQIPAQFDMPTHAQFATWLATERRRFLGSGEPFYAHHPTGRPDDADGERDRLTQQKINEKLRLEKEELAATYRKLWNEKEELAEAYRNLWHEKKELLEAEAELRDALLSERKSKEKLWLEKEELAETYGKLWHEKKELLEIKAQLLRQMEAQVGTSRQRQEFEQTRNDTGKSNDTSVHWRSWRLTALLRAAARLLGRIR